MRSYTYSKVTNKNTYEPNPYNDNAKRHQNSRNTYQNLSREESEERIRYYQGVLTQFKTRKLRSHSTTLTQIPAKEQAKSIYSKKVRYPKLGKVENEDKRESPVKVEINCNLYKPCFGNVTYKVPKQRGRNNQSLKSETEKVVNATPKQSISVEPPQMREKVGKSYDYGQLLVRSRQPGDKFTTSKAICQMNTEESYSTPLKTENIKCEGKGRIVIEEDIEKRLLPWRANEKQKLLQLHQKYPGNWARIASLFQNRDKDECRQEFAKLQNKTEGKWSKQELDQLNNFFRLYGNKWSLISKKMPGRTAQQIKDKIRDLKKSEKKKSEAKLTHNKGESGETNCSGLDQNMCYDFTSKVLDAISRPSDSYKQGNPDSNRFDPYEDHDREYGSSNYSYFNSFVSKWKEFEKSYDKNTNFMLLDEKFIDPNRSAKAHKKASSILKMNSREQFDNLL